MTTDGYRTFVVVNPRSGNGATGRRFEKIAEVLREHVGAFDHAFTDAPGHGIELARGALREGYEMVVAVGGDGTFNEVVGGFFDGETPINPDAVLGLVPQGTGGDLRKTLEVDKRLRGSAARLAGRDFQTVDVGVVELTAHDGSPLVRPFINISSFGASGRVVDTVNKSSKALGGKLSFMIGSARALAAYRDQTVTLRFDDEEPEELPVTVVAVCNGQYFGGGMWVAPKAKMDDGVFDVTIWSGYTLKDFAVRSRMLYNGSHLSDPRTRTLRCRRVEASSDSEVLIDLDGEQPGRLPAVFRILPGAIRVKC